MIYVCTAKGGATMRILEELWYGNVNLNYQLFQKNTRFSRLMNRLTKNEDKLLHSLNAEEKNTFEKYRECQAEITQICECEAFIKGFRLGAQIMLGVLRTKIILLSMTLIYKQRKQKSPIIRAFSGAPDRT